MPIEGVVLFELGKTLITRYQASLEPHDVTSAQLSMIVWKIVFVLFNSTLKYVINRSMHRVNALGPKSVSRYDNRLDMEKGMH